jgi:hypothetical protein
VVGSWDRGLFSTIEAIRTRLVRNYTDDFEVGYGCRGCVDEGLEIEPTPDIRTVGLSEVGPSFDVELKGGTDQIIPVNV